MKWILYRRCHRGLIGATVLVGYVLPATTTISRSTTLPQPPAAVFAVLADVRHMAERNRNTEKVEILPPVNGKVATEQTFKGGMMMIHYHCGKRPAASSRPGNGRTVRRLVDLRNFA